MPRKVELTPRRKRTHVVAGILRNAAGQILISDRSRAASMRTYWEFPGGKVEEGESIDRALRRELAEELGIAGLQVQHLHKVSHDYPDLHVEIDFFTVSSWSGTPIGREGQQLRWLARHEFDEGVLLPADEPILELLDP